MRRSGLTILFSLGIIILAFLVNARAPGAKDLTYPQRPVQMIVSYAAGGPMDLITRALSEAIKPYFPQPIVVVNKPGGGGNIGYSEVAMAKPDGYTLCIPADTTVTVAPFFMRDLPFKGPDDFTWIIKTTTVPEIIIAPANSPYKTIEELLSYAKANPGAIRLGHSGKTSVGHLHILDLASEAKVQFTDVAFSGAAPSITAVMGGHIEGGVIAVQPAVLGNVKAGKLKILATWNPKRLKELPDVPTLKELGYDTMTQGAYYMIAGPKGIPKEVVDILYDALQKAMKTDSYQKFAADNLLYVLDYKGKDELKSELEDGVRFYAQTLKKWGLTK